MTQENGRVVWHMFWKRGLISVDYALKTTATLDLHLKTILKAQIMT